MVTTDFSEVSLSAWSHAAALARAAGAKLTVVHVVEPAYRGLRIQTTGLHEEMRCAAAERLHELVKQHSSVLGDTGEFVQEGRPASAICGAAEQKGADLIVIASHGHSGLKHVMLGSVAADVVRHAPCAVLVIPSRTEPKPQGT